MVIFIDPFFLELILEMNRVGQFTEISILRVLWLNLSGPLTVIARFRRIDKVSFIRRSVRQLQTVVDDRFAEGIRPRHAVGGIKIKGRIFCWLYGNFVFIRIATIYFHLQSIIRTFIQILRHLIILSRLFWRSTLQSTPFLIVE